MKLAIFLLMLATANADPIWQHSTGNHNPQALTIDAGSPKHLPARHPFPKEEPKPPIPRQLGGGASG